MHGDQQSLHGGGAGQGGSGGTGQAVAQHFADPGGGDVGGGVVVGGDPGGVRRRCGQQGAGVGPQSYRDQGQEQHQQQHQDERELGDRGPAVGVVTHQAPVATALVFAVLAAVGIEVVRARGRTSGDVALAVMFYGGIAGGVLLIKVAGGTNAIVGSGVTVNVATATNSQTGLLTGTDWTTFNNKQAALTIGSASTTTTPNPIRINDVTMFINNNTVTTVIC